MPPSSTLHARRSVTSGSRLAATSPRGRAIGTTRPHAPPAHLSRSRCLVVPLLSPVQNGSSRLFCNSFFNVLTRLSGRSGKVDCELLGRSGSGRVGCGRAGIEQPRAMFHVWSGLSHATTLSSRLAPQCQRPVSSPRALLGHRAGRRCPRATRPVANISLYTAAGWSSFCSSSYDPHVYNRRML